jgi:hypothetical protein
MSKTCVHLMLLKTRLHMKCGMAVFLLDDVIERIEKLRLDENLHHVIKVSNLDHLINIHQNGSQ